MPLLLFPTQKSCLFLPGPSSLWGLQTSVHSALCPADPSLFPMLWAKRCWFSEVHPSRATEGGSGAGQVRLLHRGEHLVAFLIKLGSAQFLISGTSVLG